MIEKDELGLGLRLGLFFISFNLDLAKRSMIEK